MAIFNSSVKLPEGIGYVLMLNLGSVIRGVVLISGCQNHPKAKDFKVWTVITMSHPSSGCPQKTLQPLQSQPASLLLGWQVWQGWQGFWTLYREWRSESLTPKLCLSILRPSPLLHTEIFQLSPTNPPKHLAILNFPPRSTPPPPSPLLSTFQSLLQLPYMLVITHT